MKTARLIPLLLIITSASCARIAVHFESDDALKRRSAEIPTRTGWEQSKPIVTPGRRLPPRTFTNAFWGLKSFSSPVDLSSACPDGWGEFTTRVSGLQGLLHVLTLNLYQPWTVDTACRASVRRPIDN